MANYFSLEDVRRLGVRLTAALDQLGEGNVADGLIEDCQIYADYVSALNHRLEEAHYKLRKVSRSAAFQVIENDPNVLECMTELDGVAVLMSELHGQLAELQIAAPADFSSEIASELEEAYGEKYQLAALLRTHRLLAIAHAPLQRRVACLRRLLEVDPDNSGWEQDLLAYELQLQGDIRLECEQLARTLSAENSTHVAQKLSRHHKTLSSAAWSEPVPEAFVEEVGGLVRKACQQAWLTELKGCSNALIGAVDRMDLAAAENYLAKWESLANNLNLKTTHELFVGTAAAREWVESEAMRNADLEQFYAAVEGLKVAMAQSTPSGLRQYAAVRSNVNSKLAEAVAIGSRCGVDQPALDDLAAQARAFINRLDTSGRNRWTFRVVAAVSSVIVLVCATGYALYANHLYSVRAAVREEITQLLRDESFGEIPRVWERWLSKHPWLKDDRRVASTRDTVEDQVLHGESQTAGIDAALRVCGNAGDEAEACVSSLLGIGTDVGEMRDKLARADEALNTFQSKVNVADGRIKDLARQQFSVLPESKEKIRDLNTKLTNLESKKKSALSEIQSRWSRDWRTRLEALQGKYKSKDRADADDSMLRDELEEITNEISDTSALLTRQVRDEVKRFVEDTQTLFGDTDRLMQVKTRLDEAFRGGTKAFCSALKAIDGDLSPSHAKASKASAALADAHEAFAAWGKIAKHMLAIDFPAMSDVASTLRDEIKEAEGLASPEGGESFAELGTYLEEWTSNERILFDDIKDLLATPIMGDNALQTEKLTPQAGVGAYVLFTRLADSDGAGKQWRFKSETEVDKALYFPETAELFEAVRGRGRFQVTPATHIEFRKRLEDLLKQLGKVPDDRLLLDLISETLGDMEIDVLLKNRALQAILEAATGREMFADAENSSPAARLLQDLNDKVGTVSWVEQYRGKKLIHQEEREKAQQIFRNSIGRLAEIENDFKAKASRIKEVPEYCLPAVRLGWVFGPDDGVLSGVPSPLPRSGILYVLKRDLPNSRWRVVECGNIEGGAVKFLGKVAFGDVVYYLEDDAVR